ncbi:MAG: HAMP domain-containing sensor histidine kinase [Ethanoligenens sp.]
MQFEGLFHMMRSLYSDALFPAVLTDGVLRICWHNQEAVRQIPLLVNRAKEYEWPDFFPKAEIVGELQSGRPFTFYPKDGEGCFLLFSPVMDGSQLVGCQVMGGTGKEPAREELPQTAARILSVYEKSSKMPLTIIFSTLALLVRETPENTGVKGYLRLIMQNCYRLLRFSETITDIARLQMNGDVLHLKNGDIGLFVRNLCNAANMLTSEIGLPILCKVPSKPVEVCFDPVRLQRALLNLISNACRYTRAGNRIRVRVELTEKNVVVTVSDRGAGIDQTLLADLLSSDGSSTADENAFVGDGLGLLFVKTVVEKHGGTLAIDSRIGEGTNVAFTLPLRKNGEVPSYMAQEGGRYLENRFSAVYVELADVCGVPMP